jgi:hypothetical protein
MSSIVDRIFNLTYARKLELVRVLGVANTFNSIMVEIHQGYPEKVAFDDYQNIDNGMDYHFRNRRNMVASETLYNLIQNDADKILLLNDFFNRTIV